MIQASPVHDLLTTLVFLRQAHGQPGLDVGWVADLDPERVRRPAPDDAVSSLDAVELDADPTVLRLRDETVGEVAARGIEGSRL